MWRMNVYNRKGWDIENREVVEETAIMTVDVQHADGALPVIPLFMRYSFLKRSQGERTNFRDC